MRLWHYQLLPYLPDAQFKGQLRELVAILHDWQSKGQTNHILINRVMDYPRGDLYAYFLDYIGEHRRRYGLRDFQCFAEFSDFFQGAVNPTKLPQSPFDGWHNQEYLRVCMANLYEKHVFGRGKSRITDDEWRRLLEGYAAITGENYQI